MPRRHIASLLLAVALASPALAAPTLTSWAPIYSGIDYATGGDSTLPLEVFAMRIDLGAAGIRTYTTPKYTAQAGYDTFSQTTGAFLASSGAQVAVNANFFSAVSTVAQPQNLTGLAVSNGTLVSAPQSGSPALTISPTNIAAIVNTPATFSTSNVYTAVAGSDRLLANGANVVTDTTSSFAGLNPRTAAGLSQDGRYLYLMVVDGRQSDSVGTSLYDTAAWLERLGAYNGINLDGGGSSTMARSNNTGGATVLNDPSDGTQRLVGNSLGIFASPIAPAANALLWTKNATGYGATDGAGTWGTTASTWYTGSTYRKWNNAAPVVAAFGSGGTAGTVALSGSMSVAGVTFNALPGTSNAYSIGATVGAQTLTFSPASVITDNNPAGTSVINANVAIASDLTVTGSGNLTLPGLVSGGQLVKSGTGTLTLAHANTYAGGTLISGGTVAITNATALGTGPVLVSNSAVLSLVNGAAAVPVSNAITLSNGTLQLYAAGASTAYPAAVNLASSNLNTIAVAAQIANASVARLTSPVTGTGGMTLTGLGAVANPTLELTNPADSFVGDVLLAANSGVILRTTVSDVIPDTAFLSVRTSAGQGGWAFNATAETVAGLAGTGDVYSDLAPNTAVQTLALGNSAARDAAFTGSLGRSGGAGSTIRVVKVGSNTQTFGSANSWASGTVLRAGAIAISGDGASPSSPGSLGQVPAVATPDNVTLDGGTLQATAIMSLNALRGLSVTTAGGTISVNANAVLTYAGNLANAASVTTPGTLAKTGPGTLSLSGLNNAFSGKILISDGTLRLTGGTVNNVRSVSAITVGTAAGTAAKLDVSNLVTGQLNLAANQAISGYGTVLGGVATTPTSHLSPGQPNAAGTLTVAILNLSAGATLDFDLGPASDLLAVTSALTLSANPITLNLTDLGHLDRGTYALLTYNTLNLPANADLDSIFTLGALPASLTDTPHAFFFSAANHQILLTIVPEPSTLAFLPALSAPLIRRQRHRPPGADTAR